MKTYFHRVQAQTPTRFWINNVTEEEAALALEAGACGCTQNPSYTWKMLSHKKAGESVARRLLAIMREEKDDNEALVRLQRELIAEIAKCFLPLYQATAGKMGYVSIQGDPFHEDTETIIRHARANVAASPNLMAKVPVTEDGLAAIEVLLGEGIAINATEVMAVRQALDVCDVYNKVTRGMEKPPAVYISHIAGIYDEYLQNYTRENGVEIEPDYLWQAGVSVAKKAYWMARERCPQIGFIAGGARGLHHFTEMVGAHAAITINWVGTADALLEQDPPVVERFLRPTPDSVVEKLVEKLPDYEKGYFVHKIQPQEYENFGPVVLFRESFENAWGKALAWIAAQR